jgi:phosphoglycolate phosphatase
MKAVQLLIFDLDGTLVNTLDDISTSVNHTLGCFGRPPISADTVRQYVGDGIETLMMRAFGDATEQIPGVVAVYKDHHRAHLMDRSVLYPGVVDTLAAFSGIPLAVISNKTREFVVPLLERLSIARYFKYLIGADDGLALKPAPDAVLKVLSAAGTAHDASVIVGDGTTDIRAGKAADIMTCAVTYGFRSEQELRAACPDYVISRLPDLIKLFSPGVPRP